LRAQFEHFRREKWAISGAIYWMFDDCWPAIDWSLVDYFLRPKPAYYYAKRACAPVIVSFKQFEDRVQAYVTSDERLRGIDGVLRAGVLTFETCGLDLEEVAVSLPANASGSFWESGPLNETLRDPARQCVVALLESRGAIIAKSFCFALPFGEMAFPRPKLLVEREQVEENRHRMVIAANALARNVSIGNLPASARPSDNYFDLLPGEAHEVTIDNLRVEAANEVRIGVWGR
jgi:beta-mannosidase